MNRMVYTADVTRQECFEHLDEYIRNLGQDLDDYDMLTASKTLREYVRAHAGELDERAHAIGWLPLEVVAPEVVDGILESCKWQDARDVGELGDEWMGVAVKFVDSWRDADAFFCTAATSFGDEYAAHGGTYTEIDGWGYVPKICWQTWWEYRRIDRYVPVKIDGMILNLDEDMYMLHLNGVFNADDDEAAARKVAGFLACVENAWLKNSVEPDEYIRKTLDDTGLPMAYWTTGNKED